jgi:Uma2 family endonuclease
MSEVAKRRATYADVLAAPAHHVAQVLDGELYVHPRPARRHLRTASSLGARLHVDFDAGDPGSKTSGGEWVILAEPELHLGGDILVPDLAGWLVNRFPGTDQSDDPFLTVAPDWVAEIHSPSTRRIDRMKKVPIYARESVRHLWLIEPVERSIEVLRLLSTTYEIVGVWGGEDEGPFTLEPFDAVPLPATAFWGRPLPTPPPDATP